MAHVAQAGELVHIQGVLLHLDTVDIKHLSLGGSMVALIGGSIYRAMPVAMIAGCVAALTLSLALGAAVTARKKVLAAV